jgi:hypothetical protein
MRILILSLIGLIIASCSANFHLRRAEHHLKKAELKGAVITHDTLWKTISVPVPEVSTDTVFKSLLGDTIRIEKDRLKIKYVRLPGDSVFIEGKCESDTVRVEVPITITKNIQATSKIKWWWLIVAAAAGGLAMLIRK